VEHPEKVLGEALIAHDDPPKVLQPGKESFDLPSPSVAPQRATVLRPLCAGPLVRRNQFHAIARQFGIQSVRLVGVAADETRWELADKSLRECGVNQGDFMRRGTLDVDGDRAPCRSEIAMIFDPLPRFVLPTHVPPRLAGAKLPSMNASCRFR
jgi:hypothetical protein